MKTNEFYLRLTLPNEGAHDILAAATGVCAETVAPNALIDPPKTPPGVVTSCMTWVSHICDETTYTHTPPYTTTFQYHDSYIYTHTTLAPPCTATPPSTELVCVCVSSLCKGSANRLSSPIHVIERAAISLAHELSTITLPPLPQCLSCCWCCWCCSRVHRDNAF